MERVIVAGARFYRIPGREQLYPSVTTVLNVISKRFLNRWETGLALEKFRMLLAERLRAGEVISESDLDAWMTMAHEEPSVALNAAGDFGTAAHNFFEDLVNGTGHKSPVPASHRTVVDNFSAWMGSQSGLQFVRSEATLWSDKHVYAGTADAVARTASGNLVIIDWKTGNRIHSESALQVSAYAKAYEEMSGDRVDEAWVVRFDKTKRQPPQIKKVASLDASFETFLSACKLWQSVQVDMFDKTVRVKSKS